MELEHFNFINEAILSIKDYRYCFDIQKVASYGSSKNTINLLIEREKERAKYKLCENLLDFAEITQDEYNPYKYEVKLSLPLIHDAEIQSLNNDLKRYRNSYWELSRESVELKNTIKSAQKWYLKLFDCVLYEQLSKV